MTGTDAIATAFVRARMHGIALPDFPGPIPPDLAHAYACQDRAISLWPDRIAGWKIGWIAPNRRDPDGEERLVGPIFARSVRFANDDSTVDFPVFDGGFAAVEAEYIYRLAADAPPDRLTWSPADALALVDELRIGVELAGSPLATINKLGPVVVVSDFGNNHGLILGPVIPRWRERADESLTCSTLIEGHLVGEGSAASLPGGPAGALAFALRRCALRGLALKAGDYVSTGAATGIHDIAIGESALLHFDGIADIRCRAVAATAQARAAANEASA